MMFKEKLVIDIMKRNYSKIQCLIGDTLELDIDILANDQPFNIESFNVLIEQGLENDKFNIQNSGITKNKNNLVCSLSDKFTSTIGKHFIDISIFKDEYKKTTFKIPFEVYEGAIKENSIEQEIFISVLDEIREEIIKAQNSKTELSSKIEEAKSSNSSLSGVVNTANTTKTELTHKIEEAESSNSSLSGVVNTANTTKTELTHKIEEAESSNSSLSGVVNIANTTKTELTHKIEEAENINNNLNQNIQNGNIEQIKLNSDDWINFKENGGYIKGNNGMLFDGESITRTAGSVYIRGLTNENNDGIYINNTKVNPEKDLMIELGDSQRRWKSIYMGNFSKDANGYTQSLNGYIIQWGKLDKSYVDGIINFPIAFPNRVLYVSSSLLYDPDMWSGRVYTQLNNNASFRLVHLERHPTRPATPIWLAIGY